NLMAMPVVSAWVMPAGILGLISMPFGFDGLCWRVMGPGIEGVISRSLLGASFSRALGRIAAFGRGPLGLFTAGLVVLCLFQDAVEVYRRVADRRRRRTDDSGAPARCTDRRRWQRCRPPR